LFSNVKPGRNGIFIKSISIRRRSRHQCDFCFSPELISRIRSSAAISPAGMSHWQLHTARNRRRPGARSDRAALRNIRPCHVSVLTWATLVRTHVLALWHLFAGVASRARLPFSLELLPSCRLYPLCRHCATQHCMLPLLSTFWNRTEKYWETQVSVPFFYEVVGQ